MMRRNSFLVGLIVAAGGCGVPAFTSSMRSNVLPPGAYAEGKCVHAGRDDIEDILPKLYAEGWRLIYASEYTSTARPGFPSNYCFERARMMGAPQ